MCVFTSMTGSEGAKNLRSRFENLAKQTEEDAKKKAEEERAKRLAKEKREKETDAANEKVTNEQTTNLNVWCLIFCKNNNYVNIVNE